MTSQARVAVLILNYNGREHLQTCLPTLAAQVYPKERLSIEVIDNGSTDGSVEFVRERFPDVRVHRFDRNLGFATPYDIVARQSDADFLAFLNNDTRVDAGWAAALVSAAERQGAHCVASRILDWDGSRVDFIGGLVSFIGHAWQRGYGDAAAAWTLGEVPLLFACGGSMLISREAYLDAGGFDRDFFAYFEDVDLGWRLALLGYRTVLAPDAITYHRLHGTAARIAFAQRLRLYERNALAMIYKNYEDASLARVLPAAIALSLLRGFAHSGLKPEVFGFAIEAPRSVDVTARMVVHLLALEDFARQLPELGRKRAEVQRRRRVSDRELAPLFGDPFKLHETGPYEAVAHALIRDFEIPGVFAEPVSVATRLQATTDALIAGASTTLTAQAPAGQPLVSVVILTLLGPEYLPDCLESLRAQTYPADRREVIVVDNASAVDPADVVHRFYPAARVIRNATNLGFAAGNNVGARAAAGEYLVFLNDDTRVHPEWLSELVGTVRRRNAVSAASRVLSWDGERLDFVEGAVNCEGKGFQIDYGAPAAGRHLDEHPLLFANGAAMIVRREPFLESGGWDEATFAYYEDVELGWRFWLLGHEVWSSPKSIVYHRHHGTSGQSAAPARVRLYERNSLRMLYTHLERDTLARVLPAALLVACDRALLGSDLSRASADDVERRGTREAATGQRLADAVGRMKAALRARGVSRRDGVWRNMRRLGPRGVADVLTAVIDTPDPASARREYRIERAAASAALDGRTEPFPADAAAILQGVNEFLDSLPTLTTRRAFLQSQRRRSDAEILSRFGSHWLSPAIAPHQGQHEALRRTILETLGVAPLARAWID